MRNTTKRNAVIIEVKIAALSIVYDMHKASAWKMESLWVRQMIVYGQIPSEYSYSYHQDGLADFSKDDGVPQSLKEFFYGYSLHRAEGMMTIEEFKEWYYQYLSLGNAYQK